jgi:hypothetical protein
MKKNKWLLYLVYVIILLCYIVISHALLAHFYLQKNLTYVVLPYMICSSVFYFGGGILLGLEKFMTEVKREGEWKINWPKAVLLGIPLLFVSTILFIPNNFISNGLTYFLYYPNSNLMNLVQVSFGYVLITSFIRVKK